MPVSMKTMYIMKHTSVLSLLLAAFLPVATYAQASGSAWESEFVKPSAKVQTSIYWYWISGHISEEGVVKDLHSMKEAGINRAFIGNIGLSEAEMTPGAVRFDSEAWWRILHAALKTATELDIEIGIFNSPGWSQSGGPWVKPEQAMRYLESIQAEVEGGRKVDVVLAKPNADFQDVKVIAFPSAGQGATQLTLEDAHLSTPSPKEAVYDFASSRPFTLRSLRLSVTRKPINSPAELQVKENGVYRTLLTFPISRFNESLNVGFDPYAPIVVSVPATTAHEFRLVIKNSSEGSGLEEAVLSSALSVERYPEKTLAKMFQSPLPYWHEYQWPVQPEADNRLLAVDPTKVVDLSAFLQGDRLKWDAPTGNWTVLRMGMLPTGVTNAPAAPEATGLEADKMSKKHIETHFNAYMGRILERIPAADRKCWKVVVQDSYETGGQNFTDGLLDEFRQRYGYDPLPFLPAFKGYVVQSQDQSDRFLWDLRRLIADKVAYDYVGGLRDVCHKHGLTTWLENYGHWGFPGEFLQYGGQSDEIGGEFWSFGDLGDIENRAASSCGHIYGKNKISAESFTSGGTPFSCYPAMMKQRGDRFFTEGINNTLLHLYISQPYEDREPGMNAWFSSEFNRKNTWYSHLDLFTTYLKRTNYMLQQGLNVADVAYFIGEDAPKMTGIAEPSLPKGYQFDYINAEVIERDLQVKDGLLTLPHGTHYRLLVLPALETMRPKLLAKIKRLIEEGATVMGPAPKRSPSLQNYPAADKEVQAIAASLWAGLDAAKTKSVRIGKGRLIDGMNMTEALNLIDCAPDFHLPADAPLLYNHRTTGDADIYFISNQEDRVVETTAQFRIHSLQPELWDPATGFIRPLPAYGQAAGITKVPLKLYPYESAFIVFRRPASANDNNPELKINYPDYNSIANLDRAWAVSFDPTKRGPANSLRLDALQDISHHDNPDIRHYSGTIVYNTEFIQQGKPAARQFISLGEVGVMAKVTINGQYAGGVWTAPYRLDITGLLKEGKNSVRIEVVTTWMNRLIGDSRLPEHERKTWTPCNSWTPDAPLQKSGLIGPVRIESLN